MKEKRIKVLFDLEVEDDYPPVSSESLWAIMGSNNECIIDSIPFYVQGVSYGDTIEIDEEENYYYCVNILKSGGHSTLRIVFFDKEKKEEIIAKLEQFGCSWEGMQGSSLTSLDISPENNFNIVRDYLEEMSAQGVLDYEEPCIQHG